MFTQSDVPGAIAYPAAHAHVREFAGVTLYTALLVQMVFSPVHGTAAHASIAVHNPVLELVVKPFAQPQVLPEAGAGLSRHTCDGGQVTVDVRQSLVSTQAGLPTRSVPTSIPVGH